MRGSFTGVWDETWQELWLPTHDPVFALTPELGALLSECEFPEDYEPHIDLFADLYRTAFRFFKKELREDQFDPQTGNIVRNAIDVARIASEPATAVREFQLIKESHFSSEAALVKFLENSYDTFLEYDDFLARRYVLLLESFIQKYSLRYHLSQPCKLCPTLPGIFSSLVQEIKELTDADQHLRGLMSDFEEAISDLSVGITESRIRTCMVKQVNLLEAIACLHPDTTKNTIGAICKDLSTWPHESLRDAMGSLYKFTCDYPGIRHGGNPGNANRPINMRDMLGVSILMIGFLPYLTDRIDLDVVYHGN